MTAKYQHLKDVVLIVKKRNAISGEVIRRLSPAGSTWKVQNVSARGTQRRKTPLRTKGWEDLLVVKFQGSMNGRVRRTQAEERASWAGMVGATCRDKNSESLCILSFRTIPSVWEGERTPAFFRFKMKTQLDRPDCEEPRIAAPGTLGFSGI